MYVAMGVAVAKYEAVAKSPVLCIASYLYLYVYRHTCMQYSYLCSYDAIQFALDLPFVHNYMLLVLVSSSYTCN